MGNKALSPAIVDADAMVVREGRRAIAFVAQVAAGTAILDPHGRAIAVRLLTWGEKTAVARFARLGACFLERQVLAACAPAAEGEERAALALLGWLHAPTGTALPLDEALLGRVTADLCARGGQTVTDLARAPAPAVEALWRGLDGSAEPTPLCEAADAGWPRMTPALPQPTSEPVRLRLRERLRLRPLRQPMETGATIPDGVDEPAFALAAPLPSRPLGLDPLGEAEPADNPQLARLIALLCRDTELPPAATAEAPDPHLA